MPTCALCEIDDDEPEEYGEFMEKSGISVHYYCLLLSTNLAQKGLDNSGILGFLVRDIRNEIRNSATRICRYCEKTNASIACHTCGRYYHNICGNDNGCASEFVNEFHSYCHAHVPFKDDPKLPGMQPDCWICRNPLGHYNATRILRAYCCQKGYVHRSCMRKYALSAGYYLRCLWCGNKNFRDDIRRHGVFVPDREACWDNNDTIRFADLHRGYSRCDAKMCLCPKGREFCSKYWMLCICSACGASGIHKKCGGEKFVREQYTCDVCTDVLNKTSAAEELRKNNNTCAFNYTLFISKSCEEFYPPSPVKPAENSGLQKMAEPSSSLPVKKELRKREMFVLSKDHEIIGIENVLLDVAQKNSVCNPQQVLKFSNTDPLINSIIQKLSADSREPTLDMTDEVINIMELSLTILGDDG